MLFNLFKGAKTTTPERTISLNDIYTLITADADIQQATATIRTKHREGIADGWQAPRDKTPYQHDKRDTLPAVLLGIGAGRVNEHPAGYIQFDIDEGDRSALQALQAKMKGGRAKYVALCADSVSGNGSFFAFVKVEIPAPEDAPRWLVDRIGNRQYLAGVFELYHTVLSAIIAQQGEGARAGSSGKSPNNIRYLAHDSAAYINEQCEAYTLQMLKYALQENDKQLAVCTARAEAANIVAADWQTYCEQYAGAQHQPVQGQLHDYLSNFAIAANLLGISPGEVYKYAAAKGYRVTTNCIQYPYTHYTATFGIWRNRIEAAPVQTYTLLPGQRLSDVLKIDNILGRLLQAPTGTGKSYLICKSGIKAVVLCPTRALVRNFAKEYNALPYMHDNRQYTADELQGAQLIAVTYDSFPALSGYLTPSQGQFHVFCDEAHTAVSSANYRAGKIHAALKYLQEPAPGCSWASVTLVTATPLPAVHPYLASFELVKVEAPGRKAGTAYFMDTSRVVETAAGLAIASQRAGRRALVLLNNKNERLHTLHNILKSYEIETVSLHADVDGEQKEYLENLTSEGHWHDADCIITTTVLKEGNSIHSPKPVDVIICGGGFNSADIAQFTARIRGQAPDIYIVRTAKERTAPGNLCAADFYRQYVKFAELAKAMLTAKNTAAPAGWQYPEIKSIRKLDSPCIRFDTSAGRYEIDYIAIQAEFFKALTAAEGTSQRLLEANLTKYGITTATEPQPLQVVAIDEGTRIEAKSDAKSWQALVKLEYLTIIQKLQELSEGERCAEGEAAADKYIRQYLQERSQINTAHYGTRIDSESTPQNCNKILKRYTGLYDYTGSSRGTLDWLHEIGDSESGYKRAKAQATHYSVLKDADYRLQERSYYTAVVALSARLLGGTFTGEQLAEHWRQCVDIHAELDSSYKNSKGGGTCCQRHTATLNKYRQLFSLAAVNTRNDAGQQVKKYTVGRLDIAKYFRVPAALPPPEPGSDILPALASPPRALASPEPAGQLQAPPRALVATIEPPPALAAAAPTPPSRPAAASSRPATELTEAERLAMLQAGQTVVVDCNKDRKLLAYAKRAGLFEHCGGNSIFASPYKFKNGINGNFKEVHDNYEAYINSDEAGAQQVRANVHKLRGRALGCWCGAGAMCHCHTLKRLADG